MGDNEDNTGEGSTTTTTTTTISTTISTTITDPEFNVRSEEFNPLKALLTADFRVTRKQPKVIFQNMAALESAINRVGLKNLSKRDKRKTEAGQCTTTTKTEMVKEPSIIRRFQEHQMIQKTVVPTTSRHERNLFVQISQLNAGPLSALKKYSASKVRVIVVIRREHGIRGHLEGVLQCFDRYWNLLLTNVVEKFIQRKTKYSEQKMANLLEAIDCRQQLRTLGLKLPSCVKMHSVNRKNIEITRMLPQVFVRGEHIVVVYPKENKIHGR